MARSMAIVGDRGGSSTGVKILATRVGYTSSMDRGDRERRRTERAVSALRRIEDISVRVVRGLWTLAIAAAACVCVAWSVWVVDTPRGSTAVASTVY